MCGIIGYIGSREAAPILFDSLKKLEYRGYDSCGIATLKDNQVHIKKDIGKIDEIHSRLNLIDLPGNIGIGHTRWATHGKVNQKNAHPIFSNSGNFAIVQNGIVENYQELKNNLKYKGYTFKTDTDTEIIANLIEDYYKNTIKSYNRERAFSEAVRLAFSQLVGRNAIVVINKEVNSIIAVRNGSPLIVGKGNNEFFVASDIPAFLEYTDNIYYLDDGHMTVFTPDDENVKASFYDIESGNQIERRLVKINLSITDAEKGENPHFLIKEIRDQKDTIRRAINQEDKKLEEVSTLLKNARNCFLMGAGTAFRVCLMGEYLLSDIAHYPAKSVAGHEFKNYLKFVDEDTVIIVISQSGETADDLEPMDLAIKKGAKIISIVNSEGSSIDRKADYTFLLNAGIERAVASTKATTSQAAILALIAYSLAGKLKEGKQNLSNLASSVNDLLNPRYEEHIKKLAEKIKDSKDLYIIGRGVNYPAALESEIKLTETSYIHSHGFAGGELKHYCLSLITEGVPAIVLSADNDLKYETRSNAREMKSRGGYIIGISPFKDELYDYWLRVPNVAPELSGIVNIIPVQVLGYYLSILRGCDPDKPRNLAKAVTVK